mmetsp:Transcript_23174/g.64232  ORF Transcript_23174/g.64232 Transcript_23174/m.64232 type:complete len:94 (+) Transcript_23174:1422-1703(+)
MKRNGSQTQQERTKAVPNQWFPKLSRHDWFGWVHDYLRTVYHACMHPPNHVTISFESVRPEMYFYSITSIIFKKRTVYRMKDQHAICSFLQKI